MAIEWGTSDTLSALALLVSGASVIYAYKTYKATVDLKKHDFSLELQTANETLRAAVGELPKLLAYANRSRRAVLSATGGVQSSAWERWSGRAAELQAEIQALHQRLPAEEDFEALSLKALTSRITATHGFQVRASAVQAELQEETREDDRQRDHLREDHRAGLARR